MKTTVLLVILAFSSQVAFATTNTTKPVAKLSAEQKALDAKPTELNTDTPKPTVTQPVTQAVFGVTPAALVPFANIDAKPPLTGTVTTIDVKNPKTLLTLTQAETLLDNGMLKKKCHSVAITLTNKTTEYLEVLQVDVLNGLDANSVAAEEAQASQRRRSIGSGLMRMAASAIPYAGYGSMAAYQAVHIGSNVAYQGANMMANSGDNTPGVVVGFQQRLNNVLVNPQDSIKFQTLVAKGTPAQLRVTFKNIKTNEIYSYQSAE